MKKPYYKAQKYFLSAASNTKTTDAFLKAIEMLKDEMPADKEIFYRYDAWQMFKHTLGIYNMTPEITGKDAGMCIRLLKECFGDEHLQDQLIACYAIGWSITSEEIEAYPQLKFSDDAGDQSFYRDLEKNVQDRIDVYLAAAY